MKRILGISILLFVVFMATWLFCDVFTGRTTFLKGYNLENVLRRTALFGILAVGVAFVIITGGIDLSIGSVVCLVGVGFPWLTVTLDWPLWAGLAFVFLVPLAIGLTHGILVTKLNLQPFIVTLCGLLMYRGITRGFTRDQSAGLQNELSGIRWLVKDDIPILPNFGIPVPLLILTLVAVLASIYLNKTIYGRYLLALGNNEEAARFSGIDTDKMKIIAYVICSMLAGLGGLLFVIDTNSAQPVDFGNFYELYAIAAAVLGGCSLRGGTGTILGVIIGTALLQLLRNMINLVDWISPNIEFAVIGAVILAGAVGDEIAKKIVARRGAQST